MTTIDPMCKVLYKNVCKGKRLNYRHAFSLDSNLRWLSDYAANYEYFDMDKIKLIKHEGKMIYEELLHPELTLARNYKDICNILPKNASNEEVRGLIDLFNANALLRFRSLPSDIFSCLSLKEEFKIINKFVARLSKSNDKYSQMAFTQIKKAFYGSEEFFYKTADEVNQVLKNPSSKPEEKRVAVWYAGKLKSDENFEIIKNIALNGEEKDIKQREFAIHSVSLYLKQKPDEVKNIIQKIKNEESVFSPLAGIIMDKIKGKYHGVKDREFRMRKIPVKDREEMKENWKSFAFFNDVKLNRQQQNKFALNLFYFNKITKLKKFRDSLGILPKTETVTYFGKNLVSKRNFSTENLRNQGEFYDTYDAIFCEQPAIVMTKYTLVSFVNNLAHELGHFLQFTYKDNKQQLIETLYKNAENNNNFMDFYAASSCSEYFAQACEAMISVYKPHSKLLLEGNGNTRYTLMVKDPKMYKFLKKELKVQDKLF